MKATKSFHVLTKVGTCLRPTDAQLTSYRPAYKWKFKKP